MPTNCVPARSLMNQFLRRDICNVFAELVDPGRFKGARVTDSSRAALVNVLSYALSVSRAARFIVRVISLVHRRFPRVGLLGMAGPAEDERAVAPVGARNRRHPRADGAEAVAHAGEERDVDESPAEPTDHTPELDRTGLQHRLATADICR